MAACAEAEPLVEPLDELRRRARGLENRIEATLVAFANATSAVAAAGEGAGAAGAAAGGGGCAAAADEADASRLEGELEGLLEELGELNHRMTRHWQAGTGPADRHTLQRHREVLTDLGHEYRRARQAAQAARQRARLLDSVRRDIRDFRAGPGPGGDDVASVLRERTALHNAVRLADEVIGRAQSTQSSLSAQRSVLGSVRRSVLGLAARAPGIRGLVGRIQTRERRDQAVLGAVAGVCMIVLLWGMFG